MACINTKAGKLKRALALQRAGIELYPWVHPEPYITWEQLMDAVTRAAAAEEGEKHEALEARR